MYYGILHFLCEVLSNRKETSFPVPVLFLLLEKQLHVNLCGGSNLEFCPYGLFTRRNQYIGCLSYILAAAHTMMQSASVSVTATGIGRLSL